MDGEQSVRLLIADDHRLFLGGLRAVLEGSEFEVVAEAYSGSQVLPLIHRSRPDIALLDIEMPGMTGLECLKRIRGSYPGVKVVIISGHDGLSWRETVRTAGADGFVSKTLDPDQLRWALESALRGDRPEVAPEPAPAPFDLSPRETEVLRLLMRGLPNSKIASRLQITEQTVKFHLSHIYQKLEAKNRVEALRIAVAAGMETEDW